MHQLSYLGKETQSYRCSLCGTLVPKTELKAQTEPRMALIAGKEVPLA
mgnify:FL=1